MDITICCDLRMAVVDLGRRGRWAFSVRSLRPPEVSLEELIESASGADPGAVRDRGVGEGGCLKEVYCRMNLAADDPGGGGAAREPLEVPVEVSPAQSECCGEFFQPPACSSGRSTFGGRILPWTGGRPWRIGVAVRLPFASIWARRASRKSPSIRGVPTGPYFATPAAPYRHGLVTSGACRMAGAFADGDALDQVARKVEGIRDGTSVGGKIPISGAPSGRNDGLESRTREPVGADRCAVLPTG